MFVGALVGFLFALGCNSQQLHTDNYRVCKKRFYNDTIPLSKATVRSRLECSIACKSTDLCMAATYSRTGGTDNCIFFMENLTGFDCSGLQSDEQHDVIYKRLGSPCNYNQPFTGVVCNCGPGFTGVYCQYPPRDCQDFGSPPPDNNYDVYPWLSEDSVTIFCYMGYLDLCENPGDPGALFLSSTWDDYKAGFGVVWGDSYWLGLENMHRITRSQHSYRLRMNAKERNGPVHRSYYGDFSVDGEADYYAMRFTTIQKDPGVINMLHSGLQFRTPDFNDDGCASQYGSGFWYEPGCPFGSPLLGEHPFIALPSEAEYYWLDIERM